MLSLINVLRHTSPQQIINRILFRVRGSLVTLQPQEKTRGNVLISYTTVPFTLLRPDQFGGHTNYWETVDMARAFLERGYTVDVIDKNNKTFIPKKEYTYFIDIESNLARLTPLLNKDCIKIFHATGSYWEFQNAAEAKRLDDLKKRRGTSLLPRRTTKSYSLEQADVISSLCGPFPESTYKFLGKPIYHIPLSTTHTFPNPTDKDFDHVRKQFIWFGGVGGVHKGLDLVLEAFAAMPEYQLLVCGKLNETDFLDLYHKELFETSSIKIEGYIDPGSEKFREIVENSLGIVFPSCSEGCASSVVISMHAGLIPIISRESGVEVGEAGVILKENTIEEITRTVQEISSLPINTLKERAVETWQKARTDYTRERFAKVYREFVDTLETMHNKVSS